MGSEILAVPEESLDEVIRVIRVGLAECEDEVTEDTREALTAWCDEMSDD